MKTTLLRTYTYAVALILMASCLAVFAGAPPDKSQKKRKVEIGERGVVVHPTIKLSPGDGETLDAVLAKYNEKLYRVATLEKGKETKLQGTASLDDSLKAEYADAQRRGLSVRTHHAVCPNAIGCTSHKLAPDEKRFLKELGEVLAKY
jgi:hypothetical protein